MFSPEVEHTQFALQICYGNVCTCDFRDRNNMIIMIILGVLSIIELLTLYQKSINLCLIVNIY